MVTISVKNTLGAWLVDGWVGEFVEWIVNKVANRRSHAIWARQNTSENIEVEMSMRCASLEKGRKRGK